MEPDDGASSHPTPENVKQKYDVKDAVTAEIWSLLAMVIFIKNMASSWETFGLDNIPDSLIKIVRSDANSVIR